MIIEAKKISKASLFKLLLKGLGCGFFVLFVGCGVAAILGAETVSWNGEPVKGLMGGVTAFLMWPFFSLFLACFIWLFSVFGLWIYSFFGTLSIEFKGVVENAE
ncbi:MAG: hypothetical protein KBT88_00485 [Gammaproteobacteria bacterium]|nr:hypothetical protein [Gammaproteobacteria bacterium]MBQ0838229.1 hypothetical protein [Gammaproteobacteria bacterium]